MHRCSILPVDDERAARDAPDGALRLEGYEVELAAGGEETLGGSATPENAPNGGALFRLRLLPAV